MQKKIILMKAALKSYMKYEPIIPKVINEIKKNSQNKLTEKDLIKIFLLLESSWSFLMLCSTIDTHTKELLYILAREELNITQKQAETIYLKILQHPEIEKEVFNYEY